MFNVRPWLPGFRVVEPQSQKVPGFHVSVDGSAGPDAPPADRSLSRTSMRSTSSPAANRYVDLRGALAGVTRGTFLDDIKDLPEAIADRVGALAKGAYSVGPGVYYAGRAAARGLGLLGPEEAERFRRELELIRSSANAIVERPGDAARAAYYGADQRFEDPLLKYHLLGRGAVGYLARVGPVPLGPVALIGDTLRAFENGRQNLVDAVLDGIQGER